MTARIRFIRRPGVSVLWLVALTAAALLLAVGSGVLWSVIGLRNYMDEHFISVAVLTRTEEQMEELENSMAAGGLGLVLSAPVLTQQELGERVGVTRQTILAIERGDYNPTIKLCVEICKALGKTLDELFWEE